MRKVRSLAWCVAIALVFGAAMSARASEQEPVAIRFRFGMKDKDGTDWSGKLTSSGAGKVESIHGWKWMPGDHANEDSWTVATRRAQAQGRAERQRVANGGKMPMSENGVIVTISGAKPEDEFTFDSKGGKATFKLSDLPYGKRKIELDGNLVFERVPASDELADTNADEDYPAVAMSKDGTLYVAYLAFTHGKDFQGPRERVASSESGPVGDPTNTTKVKKITKPEDLDYLAEPTGGEQIYLRVRKGDKWTEPVAVTDGKLELYRPAIAVDGEGKVWVMYSAHVGADKNLENGNWELMARRFDADGKNPGEVVNVSNTAGSDFMPAATTDSTGKVWVTWVGARETNYKVFAARQEGEKFSAPMRVTQTAGGNEWEPAIAADGQGNVALGWDTYEKGDYDVRVAKAGGDGKFGEAQVVAGTLNFEVRPSLTFDGKGQLWIAWEESGDQWGKDWGALKKKGIPIYSAGRSLGTRVLGADGKWLATADIMDAIPPAGAEMTGRRPRGVSKAGSAQPTGVSGSIAPCYPRLASDEKGNVFLAFRGKPGGNWRVGVGSVWFEYVTKLTGDGWSEGAWLPHSNNLLDNRPAVTARDGKLTIVYSGDGRGERNPVKLASLRGSDDSGDKAETEMAEAETAAAATQPVQAAGRRRDRRAGVGSEINADIFVATLNAADFGAGGGGEPKLTPVDAPTIAQVIEEVSAERDAIKVMRDYRYDLNGESLRIWRGEFHRHTEYSFDGGNDGGLLDLWRYAIDAADLDWVGDGDHDYGTGREYSWWTTQKAVTLFTRPGRFVPMYCYERSVNYPEGHRNCMFAVRGVRSLPRLPLSDPEKFAPAPDTNLLYMYLKHFDGLTAPHTSATDMGTDWRNYDPQVEPFVEIYQGDRNNYERPDAPRSAVTEAKLKQSTPEKESLGGWRPKGFVNLALQMGRRYAFESSSDHISTHLSYCNVLVTEPTRAAILDAVKKRRVYGATDNIVADVRCKAGDKERFMGEEFSTSEAPMLDIHIVGAQRIAKVTIVKDDEVVFETSPDTKDVKLSWTDPKPTRGQTSYYYVRGEQVKDLESASSGELVWASPMWIKYEGN